MDFAWSDQQRELLDAVGRFASQQLKYNVIDNDRDGVFNHDAWEKCGSFGIQGLPVPTQYGGLRLRTASAVGAVRWGGSAFKVQIDLALGHCHPLYGGAPLLRHS